MPFSPHNNLSKNTCSQNLSISCNGDAEIFILYLSLIFAMQIIYILFPCSMQTKTMYKQQCYTEVIYMPQEKLISFIEGS
jgi:hypothetical protein